MFSSASSNSSTARFFSQAKPPLKETGQLRLGNFSMPVPLCKLPDGAGFFMYFKLNDHPGLIEEAARLIAARIKSLGLKNPYFVTPEASTLALAHVLRHHYNIDGATIYKTAQINDIDPISISYDTVTSSNQKALYLGKNKAENMRDKDIIILDSVCTTGGTLRGIYQLLIKAGIPADKIIEATLLFNEGNDRNEIAVAEGIMLKLHRFDYLPLIKTNSIPSTRMKIALGSENTIKMNVVKNAFAEAKAIVIGKTVKSGVPEQPEGDETLEGAKNRAINTLALTPDADIVIGIENGIFKLENGEYIDKAAIYCLSKADNYQTPLIFWSDTVALDKTCVEMARARGFDKYTVGMVMQEQGLVTNHKDPHVSLSRRTRESFLATPMSGLAEKLFYTLQESIRPRF
jgi:non-canonical (house-cleaning) NTP pyrophosphatase/adenine/guanine phosphoribosyltransferase-like PRPP-binding protein